MFGNFNPFHLWKILCLESTSTLDLWLHASSLASNTTDTYVVFLLTTSSSNHLQPPSISFTVSKNLILHLKICPHYWVHNRGDWNIPPHASHYRCNSNPFNKDSHRHLIRTAILTVLSISANNTTHYSLTLLHWDLKQYRTLMLLLLAVQRHLFRSIGPKSKVHTLDLGIWFICCTIKCDMEMKTMSLARKTTDADWEI